MKRAKRHKIKTEMPETSASHSRQPEDYDLTYYIHDRVELMHQVFSVLKPRDMKAMAPDCVRHISIDDLQELCTEELLGISSKRLCAILDGADPPSDTESSSASQSPERLETISLDSISSDEEILSQASSKKNKKHKHRRCKSKSKKKSKEDKSSEGDGDRSRASRAGLTVLELLELQARARAIRAQLQKEQAAKKVSYSVEGPASPDSDVQVKEEPPEVLEISSDEDSPSINLHSSSTQPTLTEKSSNNKETAKPNDSSKTITVINDLIITVPQPKPTRKIKLKRNRLSVPTDNNTEKTIEAAPIRVVQQIKTDKETTKEVLKASKEVPRISKELPKEKLKRKHKRKEKRVINKDGSDHDEITLQLSDSEKIDLLEGLDRKNYEQLSSSSSEDTESSSDTDGESQSGSETESEATQETITIETDKEIEMKTEIEEKTEKIIENLFVERVDNIDNNDIIDKPNDDHSEHVGNTSADTNGDKNKVTSITRTLVSENPETIHETEAQTTLGSEPIHDVMPVTLESGKSDLKNISRDNLDTEEKVLEVTCVDDIPIMEDKTDDHVLENHSHNIVQDPVTESNSIEDIANVKDDALTKNKETEIKQKENDPKLSDGELSDNGNSDIETLDVQPEVVCISDDETDNKSHKKKKKNKNKEKKSKKQKKAKKSKSDFCQSSDHNFYSEQSEMNVNTTEAIDLDDDDDVYEILEISDDSSCYEVEGTTLSKDPTAEEIEALSAKIDEINKENVIIEKEKVEESLNDENIENISWKDRYLDSKKVKKVLSTANILNALRKKNRILKKKLEESKNELRETETDIETNKEVQKETNQEEQKATNEEEQKKINVEEGSIDHFNTLEGSTKYVAPVVEIDKSLETDIEKTNTVSKEMKKEAKQLLKMYKRLLKYNDMTKVKDPSRKKKKKKDKNKETVVSSVA